MSISTILPSPDVPRVQPGVMVAALLGMCKAMLDRRADRLASRHLDAVPAATLKDIGLTRPQVFAGVGGRSGAARR